MSHLEPGPGRFTWLAAPAARSVRPEPGCVQCGSRLDGPSNHTGKCFNCAIELSEDDEVIDELEE
jgi:hypothetical protein